MSRKDTQGALRTSTATLPAVSVGSYPSPHPASGATRASEACVRVEVNGRPLLLPEHALCAGLSDLRLATGAGAGLEDYAAGVALVLAALERRCILSFRRAG